MIMGRLGRPNLSPKPILSALRTDRRPISRDAEYVLNPLDLRQHPRQLIDASDFQGCREGGGTVLVDLHIGRADVYLLIGHDCRHISEYAFPDPSSDPDRHREGTLRESPPLDLHKPFRLVLVEN